MHKFTLIKQFNNKLVNFQFEGELLKVTIDLNYKNPAFRHKFNKLIKLGALPGETVLIYKD